MSERDYEINGRIFKRERYKPSTNDTVLVSNTTGNKTNNQLALSWDAKGLEKEYQVIACKVMLNEWAQRVPQYPVLRAFVREGSRSDNIELFITFEVVEHLESSEIRLVMTHATASMTNCLSTVAENIIKEHRLVVSPLEKEPVEPSDTLNKETERKEQRLENRLEERQASELIRPTTNMTEQLEYLESEIKNKNAQIELMQDREYFLEMTKTRLEASNKQWDSQLEGVKREYEDKLTDLVQRLKKQEAYQEMLVRQREGYEQQLSKSEELNRELDKANVLLNARVGELRVDHDRLEKVGELEKEVSHLKEKVADSLSVNQRLEMTNQALEEALTHLETNHHHLVEKVQTDYNALEETLKEAEKRALLEASNKNQALYEKQAIEERYDKAQEQIMSLETDKDYLDIQLKEKEIILAQSDEQKRWLERLVTTLEEELEQLREEHVALSNRVLEMEAGTQREELQQSATKIELDDTIRQLTKENELAAQHIATLLASMPQQDVAVETFQEAPFEVDSAGETYSETWAFTQEEDCIYEKDPFKRDVAIEELTHSILATRKEEEEDIVQLFDLAEAAGLKQVRLTTAQFKDFISELRFLNFRWNQIYELDSIDHKQGFLKWCLPYIEDVENFQEILEEDVKPSLFSRKSVTMGEDTLLLLEAYSALSVYLDTYYLKVSSYIDKYFINEEN